MVQAIPTVDRVLAAVELVPRGQIATYGDIAELVGTTARRVGAVLATHGAGVPWWRVTSAAGELPPALLAEARERWMAEDIGLARSGRGCRLRDHRVEPQVLGPAYAAWERAQAILDGPDAS